MNPETICLPSIPALPGARNVFPAMNVVTPFAHKGQMEVKNEAIMPLPKIAEEIELPKPTPRVEQKPSKLPEKKVQKIQKKFAAVRPAPVKKVAAPAPKAKPAPAKPAKKAPAKAKAPVKKAPAKAKKK